MKQKEQENNNEHLCRVSQTSARFVFVLIQMCLFQQPNCIQEIRAPNCKYYKETIVSNHFTLGTIRYISSTSNTSYGSFWLLGFFIESINTLTQNSRPIPFSHHLLAYVQYQ